MSKKKDWLEIEKSEVSKDYRRLQRMIDLLHQNKSMRIIMWRDANNEEPISDIDEYIHDNYYLVLSSEDFAVMDAYRCQYDGYPIAKKNYCGLKGMAWGMDFVVCDRFGATSLWKKEFIDGQQKKGKQKKCRKTHLSEDNTGKEGWYV